MSSGLSTDERAKLVQRHLDNATVRRELDGFKRNMSQGTSTVWVWILHLFQPTI